MLDRLTCLILVTHALTACTESNVRTLTDRDGAVTVALRCDAPAQTFNSADEQRLVREWAGRIVRHEAEYDSTGRFVLDAGRSEAVWKALSEASDEMVQAAVRDYACSYDLAALTPRFPQNGSEVPPFSLEVLDENRTFNLQDYRGKIVVLTFWATWCRPCLDEYPLIVELNSKYEADGVVFVGVLTRDTESGARAFLAGHDGRVPTLLDPDQKVGRAFKVFGLPHSVFIGRDGRIVNTLIGGYAFDKTVEAILAHDRSRSPG
jgi:cytochrome c biogenesis protein CcmG/thiol:disulfide interchange protein DsbE